MRSSSFIIMSLALHLLLIAAVALKPQSIVETSGIEMDVSTSEINASQAEVVDVPAAEPAPAPAPTPEPVVAKPAPPKVVPVVKKKAASKPAAKSAAVKKIATPTEETTSEEAPKVEQAVVAAEAPVEQPAEELSPEIENINEMAKEEAMTEASNAEATAPAPEPVQEAPVATQAAVGASQEGPLGKGGETKGEAVAYTDLRQTKGNKNPLYPLRARKEKRQGQLELLYKVTKDGRVTDVQIAKSSGHLDLDQSAVRAISKFRFVPGQEGWAHHPVIFALKGDEAPAPSRLRTAGGEQ